ncbi:hypothetical protein ACLOJK_041201 [Asimina triloba]
MTLLIRKPLGDYQALIGKGNSKVEGNLPGSNKDYKLRFFFIKLEVVFNTMMSFFEEGGLKWFKIKEKFFYWCRAKDVHNPSQSASVLALKHVIELLLKAEPLKGDMKLMRFTLMLKEVVELEVCERGQVPQKVADKEKEILKEI